MSMNQNIASIATPIVIVVAQPVMRRRVGRTRRPMIFGLTAMNMISPMIGTDTTPLITALQ